MRMNLYSIFDKALQTHLRPFVASTDMEAARLFGDLLEDRNHVVAKHPRDFSLTRLGGFDDKTGELIDGPYETIRTGPELLAERERMNGQELLDLTADKPGGTE